MPCMCWYEPSEGSKQLIKDYCVKIVEEIKRLEAIGDPLGVSLASIKILLDHLYDPSKCEEKK